MRRPRALSLRGPGSGGRGPVHAALPRPARRLGSVHRAHCLLRSSTWAGRPACGAESPSTSCWKACPPGPEAPAWMLQFLAEKGMLTRQGNRYVLDGHPDLDLAGMREAVEREAPGHQNLDLLDAVRSHVRPFFTEGRTAKPCSSTWPCSLSGWTTSATRTSSTSPTTFRPAGPARWPAAGCRVLELGGGAGSFAQLVSRSRAPSKGDWTTSRTTASRTSPRPSCAGPSGAWRGPPASPSASSLDINRPLD